MSKLPKPIFYLSGKMRGIENENMDEFNEQAERLRSMGYAVINPAETMGGEGTMDGVPRATYMTIDFAGYLQVADAVVVLPDWKDSLGAKAEVIVAHNLEVPVLDAKTLEPIEIKGYDIHTTS